MAADYVKLYRLASKREHRINAARLATDVDPLPALAFAEDYGRSNPEDTLHGTDLAEACVEKVSA